MNLKHVLKTYELPIESKPILQQVEGGRIDHGLHYGQPRRALEELLAMEEAVEAAMKMVNMEETLMVITADHSHVMTINGYPARGNNILGNGSRFLSCSLILS